MNELEVETDNKLFTAVHVSRLSSKSLNTVINFPLL